MRGGKQAYSAYEHKLNHELMAQLHSLVLGGLSLISSGLVLLLGGICNISAKLLLQKQITEMLIARMTKTRDHHGVRTKFSLKRYCS